MYLLYFCSYLHEKKKDAMESKYMKMKFPNPNILKSSSQKCRPVNKKEYIKEKQYGRYVDN
jgi:hypothetical protein